MAHWATDDAAFAIGTVDQLEEKLRAAKVDWRLEVYGNAVHGFSNPRADLLGNPAVRAAYLGTEH